MKRTFTDFREAPEVKQKAQNINEGAENVKTEQNGNGATGAHDGAETNKEQISRVLADRYIIKKGKLCVATAEEREREQAWLDEWSHLPNFGYYVIARSVGLQKYETQEFFTAATKGDLHAYLQRREAEKAEITNAADLLEFDREDDEASLIGDRWLCKGRQAVLQGPTGVGKSSLELQWAMRLCAGLPFFGIKAAKAMRVLIIQAENDIGDMAEAFQDTLDALSAADLKSHHVDLISENLTIINNDTATGEQFRDFLRRKITQFKPDIVFVDPLLAYVGGDVLKQDVMSRFLRNWINPVLHETGVLLMWIHHISKPSKNANGQENSAEQNKYAGLGSSELQNACREVMTLSELSEGKFCLEFTKRGRRLGLRDGSGNPIRKLNIEHHKDGIVWIKSSGVQATANKKTTNNLEQIERVKKYIIEKKTVGQEALVNWGMTVDIGRDKIKAIAKGLSQDKEANPRIYTYGDPEYKESGAKPKVYSILPPPDGTKAEVITAHEDLPIEERVEMHELAEGIEERERQQAVMDAIDPRDRRAAATATKPKPTRKKKTEKAESKPQLTPDEERYNRFKILLPGYPNCKVTEENVGRIAEQLKTDEVTVWRYVAKMAEANLDERRAREMEKLDTLCGPDKSIG
jgi:AAA domain